MTLDDEIRFVRGIGPKKAQAMERLGIRTLRDAVEFYPRGYEDRTAVTRVCDLTEGEAACIHAVLGTALKTAHIRRGMDVSNGMAYDTSGAVSLRFFNNRFAASALEVGGEYAFYGKVQREGRRFVMINPEFEPVGMDRKTGRILPVYSLTAGIHQKDIQTVTDAALCVLPPQMADFLPEDVRDRFALPELREAMTLIHRPQTLEQAETARRRLVFEELFLLSCGLGHLRERRAGIGGVPLRDLGLRDFYHTLPFSLTRAQVRAIEECCLDIASGRPLSRLVQGDVGSGKTMVAAALCWVAAHNGKQAALMAPTELLAQQHMQTLQPLFARLGVSCGLLTGSMTPKQKKEMQERLAAGEISVAIGTHALLSEKVRFSQLALAVVDEQHRFGVNQRAMLTQKGKHVHLLVMSATPIPRTLALLIYGDLDVSIIDELPPGRQKIESYAVGKNMRRRIDAFIDKQCQLGGQVYVVCPLVEDGEGDTGRVSAESCAARLQQVLPHRRVGLVHGRTKAKEKDAIMQAFADGEIDILVSTTVIEVGVDVPNATLMVVENADCFGLSQLHQLRGRVGRGTRQSYCIFFGADQGESARQRLTTLCSTTDGFAIAQADLEQRGAGDFFGTRQHGLPPLKLANLAGDTRLMAGAKQAADAILRLDPELSEHPELRGRIHRMFERCGEGMFN
ncbi:MAG: ATP-dependent DNA helicase RecG [Eubacteriales bacterium]|nr:ATP-dependent DNA helicase RecG [Eubacteriales bacterium]